MNGGPTTTPEPVVDADGDETGAFYCPDCGDVCWNERKALACCADEGNSTDTTNESAVGGQTTDAKGGCETDSSGSSDGPAWRECFGDAMRYFNQQIDDEIHDHTGDGEHPDRPTTAREYYNERGWTDEVIEEYLLGYAPADRGLLAHLRAKGYDREEILATGLFTVFDDGSVSQLWGGRYVLPYFDTTGETVYAISRATGGIGGGKKGYGGHPRDFISGKYGKLAHTKEYAHVDEPIWGLQTLEKGEPVVIAEGIADAITAHSAGHSVLSPVTKDFKHKHFEVLLDALDRHDVGRVYVIPDAERAGFGRVEDAPNDPESIREAVNIPKAAPGPAGGFRTADYLYREGVDVRLVELPLPAKSEGYHKTDLDDYLHEWDDDLRAVMKSAHRPTLATYPKRYTKAVGTQTETPDEEPDSDPQPDTDTDKDESRPLAVTQTGSNNDEYANASDVFSLDITDLTGSTFQKEGDRGKNPLGHTGDSENYAALVKGENDDLVLKDYKRPGEPVLNSLTYLLVEAGKRTVNNPEGPLSVRELFEAWKYAKRKEYIDEDDPIPLRALFYALYSADGTKYDKDSWVWRTVDDGEKVGTSDDKASDFGEDVRFGMPPGGYNDALDIVEDEHDLNSGRERVGQRYTEQYTVEKCTPPTTDAEPFDIDARRDALYERYRTWIDDGRPVRVFGDPAGAGKTTSTTLAADAGREPHAMLADKHTKGHEHATDDVTPDGYHHLRGAGQPVHDCCMQASAAAGSKETPHCHKHGHPSDWPKMCPVYQRGQDDDIRQRYEALVPAVGPMGAHIILHLFDEDEHPWHAGHCRWSAALDALNDPDTAYVVGVHEHQTLKTVSEGEKVGERSLIVDEKPRENGRNTTLDVEGLTRMSNRLTDLAEVHAHADADLAHNLREFGAFAARVCDAIISDEQTTLDTIDAPDLEWEQYRDVKDPLSGSYVTRDMKDETLAQTKLEYTETTVNRIQRGEWNGEPVTFDALLGAALEAGIDDTAARRAIAAPNTLDDCPWCGSDLSNDNGLRFCAEEGCGWHEAENSITTRDDDPARAVAWLQGHVPGDEAALGFRALRPASDMPDNGPLVLDATATRERIAGVYGVAIGDVDIEGADTPALDGLRLTQISDGQYHAGTIIQSDAAQRRIQQAIDAACAAYEHPLFGIKRDLKPLFEWPANAEVLYYGAARGLNKTDCDAVVCVGAPHPDMDDIKRTARLFAQDHPDLDAGGEEMSTRRNESGALDAEPPVYRKLRYTDENGDGRAVPTKAYSGVAGALFREAREKELVQFVHRVRPLLVDTDTADPKDAYLLTNVPTKLPVAEFCEFDELTNDLADAFPATDGAIRLLEYANGVLEGEAPDGFRPETLLTTHDTDDGDSELYLEGTASDWHTLAKLNGEDVSKKTIYNRLSDLEETGIISHGEYTKYVGAGYSVSTATLKMALTVLTINADFKVASTGFSRQFRNTVLKSGGVEEWARWVEDQIHKDLPLDGDVVLGSLHTDGGTPPPD